MLGPADRRGLTPLFWQHVRPYGEVHLDMGARLQIGGAGQMCQLMRLVHAGGRP
jgi:hypothetical protein